MLNLRGNNILNQLILGMAPSLKLYRLGAPCKVYVVLYKLSVTREPAKEISKKAKEKGAKNIDITAI